MRFKFKWIFTLLLTLALQSSFAQQKTVTGTITDDSGLPLPGATVAVQGTKEAVVSDLDGKYSISVATGQTLNFSFVGMKSKTVKVGAATLIDVKLEGESLETVVVEGYSKTRTRAESVTASVTVDGERLHNRPNANFINSLQGTVAGMLVTSSSGSPGSSKLDIQIRGLSSLNANTDPLIVVDGVPTSSVQYRNLNPNDIESTTILKDAAATSVYGNRGANGVIVVTTKRAKLNTSLTVRYDGLTGVNVLPRNKYNMSNTSQILRLERNMGIGAGAGGFATLEDGTVTSSVPGYDDITTFNPSLGEVPVPLTDAQIAQIASTNHTNWRDVFFGVDTFQSHNLSLAFGGQNTSNYTSLSYFEQGGMVPTTDFKRFTLRNNFTGTSKNEKFSYSSLVALGYSKRNELNQEANSNINNNTVQNPLHGSVMALPWGMPGMFTDGMDLFDYMGFDTSGNNGFYILEDILKENSMPSWATEQSINITLSGSYKITNDLTFTNRTSVDYRSNERVLARSPWSFLAKAVAEQDGAPQYRGFESIARSRDFIFTNIANLGYVKSFGKHKIDAGLYMEYVKSHFASTSQTANGLNPKTYVPGAGTGYVDFDPNFPNSTLPAAGAGKATAGTLSYFATADYDFDQKYGVSGVIRRDASYRFLNDYKWATFYSVGARWNIDKEAFMEGSGFSMLKLRASYGTQGNQNIGVPSYGANVLYTASNAVRNLNAATTAYNNGGLGLGVGQIANPFLRWEELSSLNLGLDWRVLDDRLEGTFDFYQRDTDQLYDVIYTSGAVSTYSVSGNNGKLRNKGFELMLRYNLFRTGDFNMNIHANGSYNKSEMLEYNVEDIGGQANILAPGHLLYEWNLVPYVGVNQANGNLLYLDKDGNVTENPDTTTDRRPLGKSFLPKYQGGFGFDANYKGFYTDVLFTFAKDFWRRDNQLRWAYDPSFIGDNNMSADMLNAWTPGNPTNFPSLTASNLTNDYDSTRYLYDSSYLRLKSVTIGYRVPDRYLDKTFLSSVEFYLKGENMLTWTKWRGFDPESFTSTNITGYPNPKTVSFGTSVQF